MAGLESCKSLRINIKDIRTMSDEEFEKLPEDGEVILMEANTETIAEKEIKEQSNEDELNANGDTEDETKGKEDQLKQKKTRKTKEAQKEENTPVMTRNRTKITMTEMPPAATINDHIKQIRQLTSGLGIRDGEETPFLTRYKELVKNSLMAIKNQCNTQMNRTEDLQTEIEDLHDKITRQSIQGVTQREKQSTKRIKELERMNASYQLEAKNTRNLVEQLKEELATEKAKGNQEYTQKLIKEQEEQKREMEEEIRILKEKINCLETTDQKIIFSKILDRLDSLEGKREEEKSTAQTVGENKKRTYSEMVKTKTVVIKPKDGENTKKISEALARISSRNMNAEDIITRKNTVIVKASTEEDATEISNLMKTAGEEEGFQVKTTGARMTKIIVHNVTENIGTEGVVRAICEKTGLKERTQVRYIKAIPSSKRENAKHVVIQLPEVAASLLIRTRIKSFFCIGMTKLYVAPFIEPRQCRKCFDYNHPTEHCHNQQYCGICAGAHATEGCRRKANCINCQCDKLPQGDHPAFSRYCPIYIEHAAYQEDQFHIRNLNFINSQ